MMDYDDQERVFAPLIGRAILNFGRIEFSTLQAAEILSNEAIIKTATELPFSKRVQLIIEILTGKRKKGDAVEGLIRLLKQAMKLAEKRNLIAHNPLLIEVSFDKGTYNHTPKICKYLEREKKVSQSDLVAFCDTLTALADELDDAIHGVLIETHERR